MIRLTCEEDFLKVWGGGPWRFGDQTLRLTKWDPDFDPDQQRSSHAMVWVKFPKLKQQFWDYEILMSIGKTLGAPIGIDKHTANRDFGFFASVLIEMDLAKTIPSQILVEVEGGNDFMHEVIVGKLPRFCGHYLAKEVVMVEEDDSGEKEEDTILVVNGSVALGEERQNVNNLDLVLVDNEVANESGGQQNHLNGEMTHDVVCATPEMARKTTQHTYFKTPNSLDLQAQGSSPTEIVPETQLVTILSQEAGEILERVPWDKQVPQEEGEWTVQKSKKGKKANWKEKARGPPPK
ncbi:Nbs resistance protein [Thalictrum thalictroides]|uniref:Nbs resistance protein n=1 Tax=Thalictrum thalictroides TaxID=46969 RepID=A0A7J6UZ80_THATH|nr:Nbs resistance protein [Thalictrum thalictroides]